MPFKLYVGGGKLTDPDPVVTILGAYFSTVVFQVKTTGEPGEHQLVGRRWDAGMAEPNDYDWPQAVPEAMFDVDVSDVDAFTDEVLAAFGDAGFVELMGRIGPHLTTDVTIQAVRWFRKQPIDATEWHVRAGTDQVEVTAFRHSDNWVEDRPKLNFVASNRAEMRDRAAVERILADFVCNFEVRVRPDSTPDTILVSIRGPDWPRAVNLDRHKLRDEAGGTEVLRQTYLGTHGEKEFIELLSALAPYLVTEWTVQSVWDTSDLPPTRGYWRVEPGNPAVTVRRTTERSGNRADDPAEM